MRVVSGLVMREPSVYEAEGGREGGRGQSGGGTEGGVQHARDLHLQGGTIYNAPDKSSERKRMIGHLACTRLYTISAKSAVTGAVDGRL